MYDDTDSPPLSRFLHIYRYSFNETAGSAQVIDYSGNSFHARTAGHVSPSFTGRSVVLKSDAAQYLSINPSFGPVLHTMNSYSITVSFKLNRLDQWSRVFDFGSAGE